MKAPGGPKLALYEYQGFASEEFPDVFLVGLRWTKLFEIKTNHLDFLQDQKKKCRIKYIPSRWHGYVPFQGKIEHPTKEYIECPHLGNKRYYVCEEGIINQEELPEGWGLFYVIGKKFKLMQESKMWRPDVHRERDLITHAFRRYASGDTTGILINTYTMDR